MAALGIVSAGLGQDGASGVEVYRYRPALISTIGPNPGHTGLVVFPLRGKAFKIPIHALAGPFAYSPNGKAIYGHCTPPTASTEPAPVALCRLDLETSTAAPVNGTGGLYATDIAISGREDHILVSGVRRQNGDLRGLFDIAAATGKVRIIMTQTEAHPRLAWRHLSLAPNGERAVASRNGRVEVINLAKGTLEALPEGLFMATWSPDGKWLAAVENGEYGRTLLMDGNLVQRRVLEHSELGWSPDSRYLLAVKRSSRCGPDRATLELIDVGAGKTTTVLSSECQINQPMIGWIIGTNGQVR